MTRTRVDFYRPQIASPSRRGVGLLEVIACTALIAVMIIPIAGVIRSSGQSIARANGSTSTEAELRRALRWLGDIIRDSEVQDVRTRRLILQLTSGDTAMVRVGRGNLFIDDGSRTILAENVRDIRFSESTQTSAPGERIGVTMALRAQDPVTLNWVTVNSTISIPPQS